MIQRYRNESGQALILMVISFVALLGMTALAIDGGKIFAERRYVQNRADAASVAGAAAAAGYLKDEKFTESNWSCGADEVLIAMEKAVGQVDLNLGQNLIISADEGVEVEIDINCYNNYIDVRVEILFDSQTSFMHFVYGGIAQNRVVAVTRVIPSSVVAGGFAIATIDETCQTATEKGIWFAGTGNEDLYVYLDGGGIFSNSCINVSGQTSDVRVEIIGGNASYYESFSYTGGDTVDPTPQPVNYKIDPYIEPPLCVGTLDPPYSVDENGTRVYLPGRYTNNINVTGVPVNLEPGLYCFEDGAGFNVTTDLTGYGVTLYFTSSGGSFDTEGNGQVILHAPPTTCEDWENIEGYFNEDCDPAVSGLLIYYDDGNTNPIKIGGTSESEYIGTIYARRSQVKIGGSSGNIGLGVQVIANSVKIHGSATINMWYDDSLLYHTPNMINLEE